MNVLASAINFGLGPSGKLCTIMKYTTSTNINWYACGDELDLSIFGKNPFIDYCWSKEPDVIADFIKKYNITAAVVVLDPQLAIMLTEFQVNVVYIDSLPFMWSKQDLIPTDVRYYCAQKYPGFTENERLSRVKNLIWVDPIRLDSFINEANYEEDYVVINFGGLHSPFGDGIEYFKLMMQTFLPLISEKIYITGGNSVSVLANSLFPNIHCKTYVHEEFLKLVAGAKLFITSPGLTTLYETSAMNKKTILLPPQNLSQTYNTIWAQSFCKRLKVIRWNINSLDFAFKTYLEMSEEDIVKRMYERIKSLTEDTDYLSTFKEYVAKIYNDKNFVEQSSFQYRCNGAETISGIVAAIKK